MKNKKLALLAIGLLFAPHFVLAAWWNPFSWKIFNQKNGSNQTTETVSTAQSSQSSSTDSTQKNIKRKTEKVIPASTPSVIIPSISKTVVSSSISEMTEQEVEAFIDSELARLEKKYKIDLTSNTSEAIQRRRDFLTLVQTLSPKDKNGDIINYADFETTFLTYQKTHNAVVSQETFEPIPPKAVKTGYQICRESYGHASWDGTSYTASGGPSCSCDAGYTVSSDGKSCKLQQQQHTPTIGVSNVSSQQAIVSNIDGEFTGWSGDNLYKLTNGQYWQQSSLSLQLYLLLNPKVLIYPSNGGYKIHVEGTSGQDVSVVPITNVLESRIDGEFTGWEGNTAYLLVNGQVWQQTDYHYHYHYAYSPQVIIYQSNNGGIKMHVIGDDNDQEISVSRIR